MDLFDIEFKKRGLETERSEEKHVPEIKVAVSETDEPTGYDEYLEQLRAERKEKTRPQIIRENVLNKFYSYTGNVFNLINVPVAKFSNGIDWYLLDDANSDKVFDDIASLDIFALQAEQIADVPDFRAPLMDILLQPEWVEDRYNMRWEMSHFLPQPLTNTGKFPKYPIAVFLVSRSRTYEARLKYNQQDKIGCAEIWVGELGRSWHSLDIRDGKIIRIVRHEAGENFPVYSI